jgi:hypothetical protein
MKVVSHNLKVRGLVMNTPLVSSGSCADLQTSQVTGGIHALWRWLMARPGTQAQQRPVTPTPVSAADSDALRCIQISGQVPHRSPGPNLPLRVLRVMDADLHPMQAGRMRISGRMVDVCAELDRLAANEARCHQRAFEVSRCGTVLL